MIALLIKLLLPSHLMHTDACLRAGAATQVADLTRKLMALQTY